MKPSCGNGEIYFEKSLHSKAHNKSCWTSKKILDALFLLVKIDIDVLELLNVHI
jgi:hypothetical protein